MYGILPKQLEVNNVSYDIRSDFRDCLNILIACNDAELTKSEKLTVILMILYVNYDDIPIDDTEEAIKKAIWFLNCGKEENDHVSNKPVYDWEQDEQMIFSSINKVANKELREVEYCHFWTFISYFNEIGEGLFSTIINIRDKKNRGKKLEKYEQEFYSKHKDMIDIKPKYTEEEQEQIDYLNNLLK